MLCRLCDPSSELHIAEHFYAQSALADLLGIPPEKINEQRLYRALDALLPHKEALEVFLEESAGRAVRPGVRPLAVRRDQHVLRGPGPGQSARPSAATPATIGRTANRSASAWWSPSAGCRWATRSSREIARMSRRSRRSSRRWKRRYGRADRIWVGDRGMVSADNIAFLKQSGRRYIVGTPKSMLKQFERELLSRRLAHDPRRAGSETLPFSRRRRDLRALPQPRSPREREGHARPLRAADRRRTATHRGQLPEATAGSRWWWRSVWDA